MRLVDILLNPNGRISRSTFWIWSLVLGLIVAILAYASLYDGPYDRINRFMTPDVYETPVLSLHNPLTVLLMLAVPLAWMNFCVMVKRWHDRGKSGFWVLIGLVPLVGPVWALIECGFLPGTRSGNAYGPSPLRGFEAPLWRDDEIPEDMA